MMPRLLSALEPLRDTPVLVYCEELITKNVESLRQSFSQVAGLEYDVFFAVKACYAPPVLKCLYRLGVGAETMTELEWSLARAAGLPASSILCNGLGRSARFLGEASREGAQIIIDSPGDLERVADLANKEGGLTRLGVRVQLDVAGFPHSPYAVGPNKLGLDPRSSSFKAIIEKIGRDPSLRLETLHVHLTLNEVSANIYRHALEQLARLRHELEQAHEHIAISRIDLGGGWFTHRSTRTAPVPWLVDLAEAFVRTFPDCRLLVEPGRFLVNDAGLVVTTVLDLKESSGKHFVILDAGTNVLIPIPTAHYRLLQPAPLSEGPICCDLVDGITNPGNVIARDVVLSKLPRPGERFILGDCGAYTSAMAAFWAFEPFATAWLDRGGQLTEVLSKEKISAARSLLLGT